MPVGAPRPHATLVRFGPASGNRCEFELDVARSELRHRGRPVVVRPQAIQALAVLLQHEGRLVTNDELRRRLWGDQHLEWRNSLHRCVRDLRRALCDDARRPRFVATVARLGYRFVGEQARPVAPSAARGAASRFVWLARAFRRPSAAFALGFASALLLPASLVVLCVLFSE